MTKVLLEVTSTLVLRCVQIILHHKRYCYAFLLYRACTRTVRLGGRNVIAFYKT